MSEKGNRFRSSTKLIPRDISEALGKLPPQANELEEAVLGAIMLEKAALTTVLGFLYPEHFYSESHRLIYESIVKLRKADRPVDMRTVVNQLQADGFIELVGGPIYIAELTSKVSSAANIEYHARIVIERAILRDLIQIASRIHQDAYEDGADPFELLNEARHKFNEIDKMLDVQKAAVSMREGLEMQVKQMKAQQENPEAHTNVTPTGFPWADNILAGGWHDSDLIIIAGRPGMAKTSFALQCSINASIMFKKRGAFFSLEMALMQLVNKASAMETQIELKTIRKGNLSELEWQQFGHKSSNLYDAKLYIYDPASIKIQELCTRARRLKTEYDIQYLIVDYLQLVIGERPRGGTRDEEIGSITRALKALAKELNIPVIALSQLSRDVEKRGGDKRPQLSDLRESGNIEQDADVVAFMYRPEYYKITQDSEGMPYAQGHTDVDIAKHRNGSTGMFSVQFIGKFTSFRNLSSSGGSTDNGVITDVGRMIAESERMKETPKYEGNDNDDTPF